MGFNRVSGSRRVGPVLARIAPVIMVASLLGACVWPFTSPDRSMPPPGSDTISIPARPSGASSSGSVDPGGNRAVGSGVNSYLWRSSLDTIAFMPLASADPYGGVIITDWRATPDNPNERFKLTVYVLDAELRADGIKVAVFRQTLRVSGIWADAPVDPASATKIENAILSRARQLRLRASVG